MEKWKEIKGYEGQYEVSNIGKVRSLNYLRTGKIKELKQHIQKHGYAYVWLTKNGKTNGKSVHRLMAQAFIPNPDNLPEIDHIDGNPSNNSIDNLRWCSHKENMNNQITIEREITSNKGRVVPDWLRKKISENSKGKNQKQVYQYTLDNQLINVWLSINEAASINGLSRCHISECCHGKRQKYKGYKWSYFPL